MSRLSVASPEVGYEVGRAVVFNRLGEIILLQRPVWHRRKGGLYELPGGKLDPYESLEAATIREVKEETGVLIGLRDTPPVVFDRVMEDNGLIHRTTIVEADIVGGDRLCYDSREHQRIIQVGLREALQFRLDEPSQYALGVLGLMAIQNYA